MRLARDRKTGDRIHQGSCVAKRGSRHLLRLDGNDRAAAADLELIASLNDLK
jgi:hypothetical protein